MEYRITQVEDDFKDLKDVPTDVALLIKGVESLESRFKNLQRGFYFFGFSVVGASITFGFTALRVFSAPSPSPSAVAGVALRALGLA